ncbi:cytochrome C biogenesis transmembrane region family protein [Methyloversatilis sp. RAC08]|uniref:sulfite exporter TauE/SafE family protein n=1 Tax=Methyloversatilis sp. RAC08 TaxID=1842540 RepID=UPI00083E2DA6|nr:sulfite exporter TauE/SafE family protein [Methyloversatilis sp. RAC08]AOF83701.1 cytochrome C biogenesis transmembrane region family protein [Methyloversatilis sp. RAC08]
MSLGLAAIFLVGLLGGVHCAGMCGGIVSAISAGVPHVRQPGWRAQLPALSLHLAYSTGRITSYAFAGAVAGGIGGVGLLAGSALPLQTVLYVLANVMMIALGLYLTGYTRVLAPIEALGRPLWARIQPIAGRFLPARTPAQALGVGLLWGFLPCGMVYSMLGLALLSGSPASGALIMLAFGLGTLPNLLLAGMLLTRLRALTRNPALRRVAGLMVLGFGLVGLARASTLGDGLWNGLICHT